MAHYAFLDDNNIVTEVIVGRDEWEEVDGITDWEKAYGDYRGQRCLRTSYNGNIRYNYAGIGYTYDPIDDAFIAPMPPCGHEELLLNTQKRWECANEAHTEAL
jgi:hypothetical protein